LLVRLRNEHLRDLFYMARVELRRHKPGEAGGRRPWMNASPFSSTSGTRSSGITASRDPAGGAGRGAAAPNPERRNRE
jgi:hypothetical protein